MPGLSLICDVKNEVQRQDSQVTTCFASLLHTDDYRHETLRRARSFLLGCTKYEHYPTRSFESDDRYVFLEGRIYGISEAETEKQLFNVAELLFSRHFEKEPIVEWQHQCDGEFVLFVLDKSSEEICVLNDALAHLPVYYSTFNTRLLLSREIRFVTNLLGRPDLERMSLAQYLVFGYPLEERTLWRNVFRLRPLSLVRAGPRSETITIETLATLDFGHKEHENAQLQDNVRRLLSTHGQACSNRSRDGEACQNVISLSGGLDSRIVAGSLQRAKIPFTGATFLDSCKRASRDADLARRLAERLDIQWQLFELAPPKGRHALMLLRSKGGMNYLAMSFLLPFLAQLRTAYGPGIDLFTGDTGLGLRGPDVSLKLRNLDDALRYVFAKHARCSLGDTARLLNLRKRDIVDEVAARVASYPEAQWTSKYEHFVLSGRGASWHYEGMDRNRIFFWLCAPLEATPVVLEAVNIPDVQKVNHRLRRALVRSLPPEACPIEEADTSAHLADVRSGMRQTIKTRLADVLYRYPWLTSRIRGARRGGARYGASSTVVQCIRKQLAGCPSIGDYFSVRALDRYMMNGNRCGRIQMDILFTITSVIEDCTGDASSLEEYMDAGLENDSE
ncbi:MAG: hypothetical protein JSV19_05640 [Phycisphaerales bacterium]|nr:MAG: hypothetical protein JSV19_05640 [Phycisphaerales bacterium]